MTRELRQILIFAALLMLGAALLTYTHSVQAQGGTVQSYNNGDMTGTGAVIAFAASGTAIYADAVAVSGSGIRCGATNAVSATVGIPVAAGGSYHWSALPIDPRQATGQHYYSLSALGCYVPNGAVVNLSWAN